MRIVVVAACMLIVSACSESKDKTPVMDKPATSKELQAVRKHAADVSRRNAAAPKRRNPASLRADAMRPIVGTWLSTGQFSGGRLRMVVSNDGSMVLEALTPRNASVSMAMGSVLVASDGSVSGRVTRPLWPLQPFAMWKAVAGRDGGISIQGGGQSVTMARQEP